MESDILTGRQRAVFRTPNSFPTSAPRGIFLYEQLFYPYASVACMASYISRAQPPSTRSSPLQFCTWYGRLTLAQSSQNFLTVTQLTENLGKQNITYAVPQGIIVTRGRKTSLPARAFDLGKAGQICNYLAPLLVAVIGTFICFPPELPVTTTNMNYTPVILVGLFIVIMCFWLTRGEKFTGPKIDWERLKLTACK